MDKLGMGLIGCGLMGRALGKQLLDVESARLVGVTDVSAEAAAQASAELEAPAVESAEALIARPDVGAVVIAAPPFEHRRLTELAAAHGRHVFVEKPMAPTTMECDAMLEAAARGGVTLMVGQVLRFYPCWRHVLELVRAGEIGEPWGVSVSRLGAGWGGWPQPWRNSLALCGGLLMEVNAHEIDWMRQLCGPVVRVYAEAERYGEDPADYPNLYFISLRFAGGAVGMLHTSTVSALNDISGKVQGSAGTLAYTDGFGAAGTLRIAPRDGEARTVTIGELEYENPVRRELRLFTEAVLKGEPSPIPGEEGRANVAIAEAAYESARTGHPVEF